MGSFVVSFAKWGGAEVIATVGSEGQAEAALEAGADHALDYRAEDVAARVREITEGAGVDRIVEVALGRNLGVDNEVLALMGTIAAYASDAEPEPRLPFWPLLFKNATIRLVGSDDLPEEAERRAVEDIASCLEAGVLRPRVGALLAGADRRGPRGGGGWALRRAGGRRGRLGRAPAEANRSGTYASQASW